MPNGRVLAAFCVVCMGITVGAIASALVAPSGSSFSLDSWGPHAPKARDSAQFPWNVAKQKSWREQNQVRNLKKLHIYMALERDVMKMMSTKTGGLGLAKL